MLQLKYYREVRKKAKVFLTNLQEQLDRLSEEVRGDLLKKAAAFLTFNFEAATRLQDWQGLSEMLAVRFS